MFRQDMTTVMGRTLMRAFWLIGVPVLLLGFCTTAAKLDQAHRVRVEAARLAACTRYRMLPVRLGDHLLSVPANGAAFLSLEVTRRLPRAHSETGHRGQPSAPHFFCLAPEIGPPPALPAIVARTVAPDVNGFRYAARRLRGEMVDFSSCDLRIADVAMGLTYRVSSVRLFENVFGWAEVEPVPGAFSDATLMMRRGLGIWSAARCNRTDPRNSNAPWPGHGACILPWCAGRASSPVTDAGLFSLCPSRGRLSSIRDVTQGDL
jgi:hypothetical protein